MSLEVSELEERERRLRDQETKLKEREDRLSQLEVLKATHESHLRSFRRMVPSSSTSSSRDSNPRLLRSDITLS